MMWAYQKFVELQKTKPFFSGLGNCKEIQEKILKEIIKNNTNTRFGKENNFDLINATEDYLSFVPIHDYDSLTKYVEDEKKGIKNSLLSEKIAYYAITSGTTAIPKYLPQTKEYIKKLRDNWKIWINLIYNESPDVLSLSGSVLTLTSKPYEGMTSLNIKFGSISGFLHDIQPGFIKYLYAVPDEVFLVEDYSLRYYLLTLFSVKKNITVMITPNPSTFLIFAKKLDEHSEEIISDLNDNHIKRLDDSVIDENLKNILQKKFRSYKNKAISKKLSKLKSENKQIFPKDVFQNLHTLACWKGGSVGIYIKKLPQYYGLTKIMDIGYMASEGHFSTPISIESDGEGVLDIYSNFYEFAELNEYDKSNKHTSLAHEVEAGKKYYIIITNENGLYRYFIDDIVEVTGFYQNTKTPLIRFLQKGKYVSSMTGEKITEWEVVQAMHELFDKHQFHYHTFFVRPNTELDLPFYEFFIEFKEKEDLLDLEASLDLILKKLNIEYAQKRASFRLGKPKIIHLTKGVFEKLKAAYSHSGDTQVKVPKLFVLEKDLKKLKNVLD